MKKVIARVRLNPGQGGYFDPITRIHLTHGDPERDVYAGMNTEGLKSAVRNKRISLISGSLGEFVPPFKLVRQSNGKVILVTNDQKKHQQQKVEKLSVKKENSNPKVSVEEKPVDIKDEITVKEPEKKLEVPVVKDIPESSQDIVVSDDIKDPSEPVEQKTKVEEAKTTNPFKKNKKKGSSKDKTEEPKSE